MNQYVTGSVIKRLREKLKLTQSQLADFLGVSDRTVSKWETGRGFPDIIFLEPLAKILEVSVAELFSGTEIENGNRAANLSKSNFYVCPVCGYEYVGDINDEDDSYVCPLCGQPKSAFVLKK